MFDPKEVRAFLNRRHRIQTEKPEIIMERNGRMTAKLRKTSDFFERGRLEALKRK